MSLQQKIFQAGLELTAEELAAIALVEAQLKARAADTGICIDDNPEKKSDGLCVESLE